MAAARARAAAIVVAAIVVAAIVAAAIVAEVTAGVDNGLDFLSLLLPSGPTGQAGGPFFCPAICREALRPRPRNERCCAGPVL